MKPDNSNKYENMLAFVVLAIFAISLVSLVYFLIISFIQVVKHDFDLDDKTAMLLIMLFLVFVSALISLWRIYKLQKSGFSWTDLDNAKVLDTIRGLTNFPLIPGILIFLFGEKFTYHRIIGFTMMEFAYISQAFWAYRGFKKTKLKIYLLTLGLSVLLSCFILVVFFI